MVLFTCYAIRSCYVEVNGQGMNIVPGQYFDVPQAEAEQLYEAGNVYFEKDHINEVTKSKRTNLSSPSTNAKRGRSKKPSKNRRKR